MMNPYFGLTEQIRQLLAKPSSIVASTQAKDLARQYAEACRAASERLNRCGECLGKGLRSEAIQLAEQAPQLLDSILALDFPERGRWLELCQQHDITPPPDFDAELVGRLNNEYASHASVEPLLKIYRKVVYVGSIEEKTSILRRLQTLDGKNPVWRQNLLPLECEQIRKLAVTAQAATDAGDLPQLDAAIRELRDTPWQAEQPRELLAGLEVRQQELATRQLKAAMEENCQVLASACEGNNSDMARAGLDAWSRLGEAAMGLATDQQKKTLKQAQKIWDVQKKKLKREKEFHQAVDDLAQLLENPDARRARLETVVNRVENFDEYTPPENLMQRGRTKLEELKMYDRRRLRMILAAGVIFMLLVSVALLLVVRQKTRGTEMQQLQKEMTALMQVKKFPKATTLLDGFLKKEKWAEGNTIVLQLRRQAQDGCALLIKEAAEFAALCIELERIKDANFEAAPEVVNQTLKRAETLANNDAQNLFIEQWVVARKVREREVLSTMEQKLGELQKKLIALLEERESLANSLSLPQAKGKVEEMGKLLAEAEKLKDAVSAESREQFIKTSQGVGEVVQAVKIRTDEENRRQEEWAKTITVIEAGTLPISEYVSRLQSCRSKDAAVKWATDVECRLTGKHTELATLLRSGAFSANSIPSSLVKDEGTAWSETIRECLAYGNRATASRKALLDLLENKLFTSLRVLTLEPASQLNKRVSLYYAIGTGKVFKSPVGGDLTLYYERPEPDDDSPVGYILKRDEISSISYMLPGTGKEVDKQVALAIHVKYLSGLTLELRNTPGCGLAPFLLSKAQEVGGWQGVSPAFKSALIQELLSATIAVDPALAKNEAIIRAREKLTGCSFRCKWLDTQNNAGGVMDSFPSWGNFSVVQAACTVRQAAVEAALSRNLSFCGVVQQIGTEPVVCLRAGNWLELWTVVSDGTSPPVFRIVATLDRKIGKHVFVESEKTHLKQGTPLLSPADGQGTATLAAKFAHAGSLTGAWPANAKAGN